MLREYEHVYKVISYDNVGNTINTRGFRDYTSAYAYAEKRPFSYNIQHIEQLKEGMD